MKADTDITLTEVLATLGYTHRRSGPMYQHDIIDGAGATVFNGTAGDVWAWLRERGVWPRAIVGQLVLPGVAA